MCLFLFPKIGEDQFNFEKGEKMSEIIDLFDEDQQYEISADVEFLSLGKCQVQGCCNDATELTIINLLGLDLRIFTCLECFNKHKEQKASNQ